MSIKLKKWITVSAILFLTVTSCATVTMPSGFAIVEQSVKGVGGALSGVASDTNSSRLLPVSTRFIQMVNSHRRFPPLLPVHVV